MDLRPSSSHTLLHDMLNADGNAAPHEFSPCQCGQPTKSTVSYGFVDGQDLLVVGVSRQELVMGTDAAGKPYVEQITKSRAVVQPDSFLELGRSTYALRSIVQHLGENCRKGHYITHVRVGAHGYWTYNDGNPPVFSKTLPVSVFSSSRFYVYEKHGEREVLGSSSPVGSSTRLAPDFHDPLVSKTFPSCASEADPASSTMHSEPQQTQDDAANADHTSVTLPRVMPGANVFMDTYNGQGRLNGDVHGLFDAYLKGESCSDFLASLPSFITDTTKSQTFGDVTTSLDIALSSMLHDEVNSTAALEVRPFVADSVLYPFYVLMEATSKALAIPPLFLVDNVTALMHSVLHKHTYAKIGRWKTKSRHWWAGVANVGEGKSQGMKAFTDDMVDALRAHSAFAAGQSHDRFHFQQSGTTAGAIDKLRACNGYLCIYCSDAGRQASS